MTDVYTICPICGEEIKFEGGFYDDKLEKHLFYKHDEEDLSKQLAILWWTMAHQIVEDDHFVKEIMNPRYISNLHEADKRKRRADILSKIMNERLYKR